MNVEGSGLRHLVGNFGKAPADAQKSFTGTTMLLQWMMIEKKCFVMMFSILTRLVQALYANQQFTIDEMHNYRMAVTEREVAS